MAFTPAALDGISLRVWYDAADTATITGSPVSALADKSSNNLDLAQGTAGRRPGTGAVTLNGLNVLTFDGGDDLVASSLGPWKFLHDGSTPYLMCFVIKLGATANPATTYGLCGTGAGSTGSIGMSLYLDDEGARNEAVVQLTGRGVTSVPTVNNAVNEWCTPNQWNIVTVYADPANATAALRSAICVNGGDGGSNNTVTNAASTADESVIFALGSLGNFVLPMVGQFAELVVTDDHTDITQIHTYLSDKWALGRPYHLDIAAPVTVTAA